MWQKTPPVSAQELAGALDRERLVGRLEALVGVASENPPGLEAEAARLAAGFCRELGFEVGEYEGAPGRPSVVARRRYGPGPVLTYCSHLDVVPSGDPALWGGLDPFGAEVRAGRMYGRGTADAKGPIAAALEAAALLRDLGVALAGTLELALVADEEAMGFLGAGQLVAQGVLTPDLAIVGEPTSLRVVRAQRGAVWIRLTTHGRAAHGSEPSRGVNAIAHMARLIPELERSLPELHHPLLGGPTLNVGTISGGAKVNVIPASCSVEIDRRTLPGESSADVVAGIEAAVERARTRLPGLSVTVETIAACDPFELPADSLVVQAARAAAAEATGGAAEVVGFRGASDARFLAQAGAETIVWGPGDITLAHTARESIELAEVETAAVAYALAFARLLAPAGGAS